MIEFQGDVDGWTRGLFPFVLGGILGGVAGWLLRGRRLPVDGSKLNTPVYRAKSGLQPPKPINLTYVTTPVGKGQASTSFQVDKTVPTVTIGDKAGTPKVSDVPVPCSVEVTGPFASNSIFTVTVRDPDGAALGAFEVPAEPLGPQTDPPTTDPSITTQSLVDGTATDLVSMALNGYLARFTILY